MKHFKSAFTYIELILVVFIISLIGTLVLVNTLNTRSKARDLQKTGEIIQVQDALEEYKKIEGSYPTELVPSESLVGALSGLTFVDKLPEYILYISNGDYYEIEFELENQSENFKEGINWITPRGSINSSDKLSNIDSLMFNGVDDYLDAGNDDSLDITDKITLAAWINPTSNLGAKRIIHKPIATWSEPYYVYSLFIGSSLGFGVSDGITRSWAWKGSISLNSWQHVAGTYDGNTLRFYINGQNVGGTQANVVMGTNDLNLTIGKAQNSSTFFEGLIDDVRIYNRALSDDEVNLLYEGRKISNVGLVANWLMNEGSGCMAYNIVSNKNHGVFFPNCPTTGPIWSTSTPY